MLRILIVGVVLTTVCVPGRCAVTQHTDKCIEATFEHHLSRLKDQIVSLDQIHRQEILQLSEKRDIDVSHLNPNLKKYIDNAIEAVVNGSEAFKTQVDQLKDSNDKMKKEMEEMNTKYVSSQKPVGFTAFGRGHGTKSSGSILKFPDVKSSFGMSRLTTLQNDGKFTCEKSGLYLISITVMSGSTGDTAFYIYKGNTIVSHYFIGTSQTSSKDYNSGTGTILLHLNVSETVYVKIARSGMYVYDLYSSFTVLKVK